jgi:hypothetical protein
LQNNYQSKRNFTENRYRYYLVNKNFHETPSRRAVKYLNPASRLCPASPLGFSEAKSQGGGNFIILNPNQREIDSSYLTNRLKTAFGGVKSKEIS